MIIQKTIYVRPRDAKDGEEPIRVAVLAGDARLDLPAEGDYFRYDEPTETPPVGEEKPAYDRLSIVVGIEVRYLKFRDMGAANPLNVNTRVDAVEQRTTLIVQRCDWGHSDNPRPRKSLREILEGIRQVLHYSASPEVRRAIEDR